MPAASAEGTITPCLTLPLGPLPLSLPLEKGQRFRRQTVLQGRSEVCSKHVLSEKRQGSTSELPKLLAPGARRVGPAVLPSGELRRFRSQLIFHSSLLFVPQLFFRPRAVCITDYKDEAQAALLTTVGGADTQVTLGSSVFSHSTASRHPVILRPQCVILRPQCGG